MSDLPCVKLLAVIYVGQDDLRCGAKQPQGRMFFVTYKHFNHYRCIEPKSVCVVKQVDCRDGSYFDTADCFSGITVVMLLCCKLKREGRWHGVFDRIDYWVKAMTINKMRTLTIALILLLGAMLLIGANAMAQGNNERQADRDWIDSLETEFRNNYLRSELSRNEVISEATIARGAGREKKAERNAVTSTERVSDKANEDGMENVSTLRQVYEQELNTSRTEFTPKQNDHRGMWLFFIRIR
jgi:hypothetical protein